MELSTQTKNNFWKTPLVIFLAIIFFPFFFTYWVYQRDWNPKAKFGFMLGFWLLIVIALVTNFPREELITTPKNTISITPQPASQTPTIHAQNIFPTPAISINYLNFDKNRGNNYFSAKYAKEYMDFANKSAPGAIKNVYLKFLPVDPAGMTEEEYKKNISETYITVDVNPFYWNITDKSTKIKLITAAINELKNTFSGLPHITITDGAKTLATASLPSLTADPVITLK